MSQGVNVASIYVRDQEEALQFYVGKLGFKVHTDVKNGDYRWLTVQHPDQPSFQLGLFKPGPPVLDAQTAQTMSAMVAKGAMPPIISMSSITSSSSPDPYAPGRPGETLTVDTLGVGVPGARAAAK